MGIVKGIMRSEAVPPNIVGETISFAWRGRETGEDMILVDYRKMNKCTITFLGDGQIKGVFNCDYYRNAQFVGRKRSALEGANVVAK